MYRSVTKTGPYHVKGVLDLLALCAFFGFPGWRYSFVLERGLLPCGTRSLVFRCLCACIFIDLVDIATAATARVSTNMLFLFFSESVQRRDTYRSDPHWTRGIELPVNRFTICLQNWPLSSNVASGS